MHPVVTVLELGPRSLPIGSYGVMLALALLVTTTLGVRAAARAGYDVGAVIAAAGCAVAGGFVGAWALQLLVQTLRTGDLLQALQRPGLVFYGGALGAVLALGLACRRLGLPTWALLDRAVPALALGHAVGRLGCLLGGCCYGAPAPDGWGVRYEHPLAPASALGVPLHPVPLYEAVGLTLLALAFARWPAAGAGRARPGRRFMLYVGLYSVLRLLLETLRGDRVRGQLPLMPLSTSQAIALALLLCCVLLLRRRRAALA